MTRPINCGPGEPCTPTAMACLRILVADPTPIVICERHRAAALAELRRTLTPRRLAHPILRWEALMLSGIYAPAARRFMLEGLRASRRRAYPPLRRLP